MNLIMQLYFATVTLESARLTLGKKDEAREKREWTSADMP